MLLLARRADQSRHSAVRGDVRQRPDRRRRRRRDAPRDDDASAVAHETRASSSRRPAPASRCWASGLFAALLLRRRRHAGAIVVALIVGALALKGVAAAVLLKPAIWQIVGQARRADRHPGRRVLLRVAIALPRPVQVALCAIALLSALGAPVLAPESLSVARPHRHFRLALRTTAQLQRLDARGAPRLALPDRRVAVRARRTAGLGQAGRRRVMTLTLRPMTAAQSTERLIRRRPGRRARSRPQRSAPARRAALRSSAIRIRCRAARSTTRSCRRSRRRSSRWATSRPASISAASASRPAHSTKASAKRTTRSPCSRTCAARFGEALPVALAGFSFGSFVQTRVAQHGDAPSAWCSSAPPSTAFPCRTCPPTRSSSTAKRTTSCRSPTCSRGRVRSSCRSSSSPAAAISSTAGCRNLHAS